MKRILIVDEIVENMSELYELLAPIYDITLSLSSLEALILIRNEQYDLIMMDMMMPEMDGFELLSEVRKLDNYKFIPILIASQILLEEEINKGFFLGANEFVTKPYHKQLLLRRIKDQLDLASGEATRKISTEDVAENTIQNMYRMMENLCEVIESKDYNSGVHIMRSGHYYKLLINELMRDRHVKSHFRDIDIEELVMASKMHDIGKIATPDNILNKPGNLTKFEFETMKNHAYNGYHILKRMSERLENKEMIRYGEQIALAHHEKWNGKGYPRHLKHEEIPLVARIMSVVDVYDALTSDRIYKKAVSHEQAINIIKKESGESFDPKIVEAFEKSSDKFLNTYNIYKELEESKELEDQNFIPKTTKEILLIEENPINREVMGSQLCQRGFNVTYSAGGMDAIMMLKNKDTKFACVLTDIKMSDFDANDFIQLIRKIDNDIVVFCITNDDYPLNSKRAEELGFDGCFLKPLDCELLLYRFNHIDKEKHQDKIKVKS